MASLLKSQVLLTLSLALLCSVTAYWHLCGGLGFVKLRL